MKRLPFALIALSLSIPVVACLNNAGDEDVASGENDLSQGARDACNFGFAEGRQGGEELGHGRRGRAAQR